MTKVSRLLLSLFPFLALAFFTIWASAERGTGSLLAVAGAMLIGCVLTLALETRWDKPGPMEWAILGYFLAVMEFLALRPEATAGVLAEYAVTGAFLCLFCGVAISSAVNGEPFSCHYARQFSPPEVWNNPIFLYINRQITIVWACVFAACAILSLYPSVITRVIVPFILVVCGGIPFSLKFPDYHLRRVGLPVLAELGKSIPGRTKDEDAVVLTAASSPQAAASPANALIQVTVPDSSNYDQSTPKKNGEMKVIAINSSPRGEGISKTGILLEALLTGMRDAGANVNTVNLHQKNIKNCIGCFTCWSKTPGVCVHEDDMTKELFIQWREADLAVYATPLYHYNINAAMKALIERTLPITEPYLQQQEGRTTHPLRQEIPKAVILSVAGFPELSVFDQLSSYARFLFGSKLIGEIYRPASEAMSLPELSETAKDILEATAQSGRELIQSGKISEATLARIKQPLGSADFFVKMANLFWASCIREGLTPLECHGKKLIPRPDSLQTFMMIMLSGFDPENAAKTRGTIQFTFSGAVEGECHFKIENGTISAKEGRVKNPDLMIESPFDLWMDIVTEKADGQQLFFQDKFKTDGDLSLLIRMKDLFGRRP